MIRSTELGIHSSSNPSNVPLLTIEHMSLRQNYQGPNTFSKRLSILCGE